MSGERAPDGPVAGGTKPNGVSGPMGRWRVFATVAGALVVPTLLWAAVPVVPFLSLTTGQKVWTSGGLVVAAEAVFWFSALLLGREVVRRYRRRLDPRTWFRKR